LTHIHPISCFAFHSSSLTLSILRVGDKSLEAEFSVDGKELGKCEAISTSSVVSQRVVFVGSDACDSHGRKGIRRI
jgi:hypothetical protein